MRGDCERKQEVLGGFDTEPAKDVETLGQVFTPPHIVAQMLSLRRNRGSILEPSAGNGAFMAQIEASAIGIELDEAFINDPRIQSGDFFAYSTAHKFDTIIGNPPYVRYRDIRLDTRDLLDASWFDRRTNLYLFFIAKSMSHLEKGGEMIFITPRDFIKSTSARTLNSELYRQGSITHFVDLGDEKIFAGACPNCAIWRWEKGLAERVTDFGTEFCYENGQIWFGEYGDGNRLQDHFDVKVGAVSGADDIFHNETHGNVDMVCSRTRADGALRKMIYNVKIPYLEAFKDRLMGRRVKHFDEGNWWEWGRGYHHKEGERIYVNCKTRQSDPFYISEAEAYDGSVLALFPRHDTNLSRLCKKLNAVDWESLGFVTGGRLIFTQKSLANARIGEML